MRKPELKPILFNTKMVKAILGGRKTVTRRIIKPQPLAKLCYTFAGCDCGKWSYPGKNAYKHWGDEYKYTCEIPEQEESKHWTPPCHGDDILYVRESFRTRTHGGDSSKGMLWAEFEYRAGGDDLMMSGLSVEAESWMRSQWKPAIHMPKKIARIFLKVKTVSVERLQDIENKNQEAECEGFGWQYIDEDLNVSIPPWVNFAVCWDDNIKKSDLDRYGWDANPWVWVIEFERISREEAIRSGCIHN